MKFRLITIAISLFFLSCKNDKKTTEVQRQVSLLKSDILLQSMAHRSFSHPSRKDDVFLTLTGKTILEAIATIKVIDDKGEELHCKTFPSKELIQPEYRTANPVLQEAHIRDVVEGYFVEEDDIYLIKGQSYAGL